MPNVAHSVPAEGLAFAHDGAQPFRGAVDAAGLRAIEDTVAGLPPDRAGIRLHGIPALRPLLAPSSAVGAVAASVLGNGCRPVRAVLFDKTAAANWALGWHQDRTVVVAERIDVPGFGPWTTKDSLLHVAPPFEVLAGMVTVRVHLDAVPATNAPLLVAPGSHRLGRVAERAVPHAVQRCGMAVCLAERGDVWLYATPILHASNVAEQPVRRRVLQVDFAADELPGGLEWFGV